MFIDNPMNLLCLLGTYFCCSVSRSTSMLSLVVLVLPKLVTPLDDVLHQKMTLDGWK